jgi:adenylate cyclase
MFRGVPGVAPDRARICRGCWDQMHVPIPIRGPLAVPFRMFGICRSKMNPNICTVCERAFRRVKKHRHIAVTATILFADMRGFTRLAERMGAIELSGVVSTFHDHCARAIWAHDGIVNKQMGDGLMAIFNFPIKIERHAEAAVMAALDIQRGCNVALPDVLGSDDEPWGAPGVGVGVHTGEVEIGEFSSVRSDFTAIGDTVNLAARLEAQALSGEILVSSECATLAPALTAVAATRTLELKGIGHPMHARVLTESG